MINIYNFAKWLAYYVSYKVRYDFIVKHLLKVNDSLTNSYLYNANLIASANKSPSSCFSSGNGKNAPLKPNDSDSGNINVELNCAIGRPAENKLDNANMKLVNQMIKTYLMHDNETY